MSKIAKILPVIAAVAMGASDAHAESEIEIPLRKVPGCVLRAAQVAVPGIRLREAEVEKSRRGLVYELEGLSGGKEVEIKIREDGKVLGIERDDDDGETDREEEDKDEDDERGD